MECSLVRDVHDASDGVFVRRILIALAIVALALLMCHAKYVFLLLFAALMVATLLRITAWPIRRWTPASDKVAVIVAGLALWPFSPLCCGSSGRRPRSSCEP